MGAGAGAGVDAGAATWAAATGAGFGEAGGGGAGGGEESQTWSPMSAMPTWAPQSEHLTVGRPERNTDMVMEDEVEKGHDPRDRYSPGSAFLCSRKTIAAPGAVRTSPGRLVWRRSE